METFDFMQKPIELAQSTQLYLRSLWETAEEIQESYAFITSVFSAVFNTLSSFLVQEAILNMAVYELALDRLTFIPDYSLTVGTRVQPEQEHVLPEPTMPSTPVFNVLLVRKLVADLARRTAARSPRTGVPSRGEATEKKGTETAEEPKEQHEEPEFPQETPFQAATEMRSQLESGLAPSVKDFASALRAYSSYAVSLSPLPLLLDMGGLTTFRQRAAFIGKEEEMPKVESVMLPPTPVAQIRRRREEEEETKSSLSESVTRKSPSIEVSCPRMQEPKLPTVISQHAETMSAALSLPSRLSHFIEEVSPSLIPWVYGESEALRSTGLSLSAVPLAASTAQRIVTEALMEPVSGGEGSETFEREVPFRYPSIFTSLMAAHARTYSPFYVESSVVEAHATPSWAETLYQAQPLKESALTEEVGATRLPSVIALAAAESLIAQKLQREMTAFAKDIQAARSTYQESPSATSSIGPVRTTKLGELVASPKFPVPIEPYAPPISAAPRPQVGQRLMDRGIQNTINLTVPVESQEEDLRELERKISKILAEQLSRYYGSTRI